MTASVFAIIAMLGLVAFIWGSLGLAVWIMWQTIKDAYSPRVEPGSPRVPDDAAFDPAEHEAAVTATDAAERAWADQWAARAGRGA